MIHGNIGLINEAYWQMKRYFGRPPHLNYFIRRNGGYNISIVRETTPCNYKMSAGLENYEIFVKEITLEKALLPLPSKIPTSTDQR